MYPLFEKNEIYYYLLTYEDAYETAEVYTKIFLVREPLTRSIGFERNFYFQQALKLVYYLADLKGSLIAKDGADGRIVGFVFTKDLLMKPTEEYIRENREYFSKIENLMKLTECLSDEFMETNKIKEGECLYIMGIGISLGFLGRKIPETLLDGIESIAIANHYKYVLADCSNPLSVGLFRRKEYTEEKYIQYKSFRNGDKYPFMNMNGGIRLMKKKLTF